MGGNSACIDRSSIQAEVSNCTWEEVRVCQLQLESLTVQTVSAAFHTDNV